MGQPINDVILLFDNWSQPWTFKTFVNENSQLSDAEKELFKSIWNVASDSSNWKDCDLISGCKITQNRLMKFFSLSEDAITNIVRAVSYEWR